MKSRSSLYQWQYGRRTTEGHKQAAKKLLGIDLPEIDDTDALLTQSWRYKFMVLFEDDMDTLQVELKHAGKPSSAYVDMYVLKEPPIAANWNTAAIREVVAKNYKSPDKASYITWFSFKSEQDAAGFDGERHVREKLDNLGFKIDPSPDQDSLYARAVKGTLDGAFIALTALELAPYVALQNLFGHRLDSIDY